ncbi:PH domain-containing protein [Melittangium boletus]|uniref:PH domain-containing protein n=1 Tax=Melittangium boletus TaxID=83453 RepID=UPI003DA5A6AB
MGLFDKMLGNAEVSGKSAYQVERFLGDGEQVLAVFRFMRDEIVVTDRGLFAVDVQGITGAKKEYKYFPLKGIKYVSYESAGTFDLDADIKIGVEGHTQLVEHVMVSAPLSFKIPKAQAADGERFFKLIKAAVDGKSPPRVPTP